MVYKIRKNHMLRLYRKYQSKINESVIDEEKKGKVKSPYLDAFGQDITELAKNGTLSPVIGRDKEVNQVIWILSRKNKNNPVIIGEAGVGKTSIVEGIAQMIVSEDCPDSLIGKRIIYLDMGTIMSTTSNAGDLEKRVKSILNELKKDENIILFIDEIHMIVDKNLSIDMSNMIKPALARGEMRLIGATTNNEFRTSIEKDNALERRFQKVYVDPTSKKDTLTILRKIKGNYEDFHKVRYSEESLKSCVNLSDKYITDRYFPDKAIDMLDEVGAKVRISKKKNIPEGVKELELELQKVKQEKLDLIRNEDYESISKIRKRETELTDKLIEIGNESSQNEEYTEITKKDVENIISLKTGIPVNKLDKTSRKRLMSLESDLNLDIIGQDEAISKISKSIKRSRSGLKDPNRPNGVFLFLGSTGTGKTQTVKSLAKHIFQSENDIIRIDMSEYAEKHNVSRLIGAPPGYVGYGEGGQLTEKVRRKPYSIILFDELEKAHPSVLNTMLQIFDDGHLTDGEGRKVDFKNTIIIMTSNIGTETLKKLKGEETHLKRSMIGFSRNASDDTESKIDTNKTKAAILQELEQRLSPEFLNRIDDVIIFNPLSKDNIHSIIDIEVDKLNRRLDKMGYTLNISDSVKDLLVEKGYDPKMGARPLKRAIQNYIEDPISDEIIKNDDMGKIIEIDYDHKNKKIIINGNLVNESKKNIITKFKFFI